MAGTLVILSSLIGGLWRRCLGGFGNLRRVYLMVAGFLMGLMISHPLGWESIILSGLLIGMWSMGHGSYMTMGHNPNPDNSIVKPILEWIFPIGMYQSTLYDFTGMTLLYLPFTVATAYIVGWPFLWVGILIPVCYLVCSRITIPTIGSFIDGYTSAAECLSGAICYGWLTASIY